MTMLRSIGGMAAASRWRGRFYKTFDRPFPKAATVRVLIFHETDAISGSQLYPFIYYQEGFRQRFGAAIRLKPLTEALAAPASEAKAAASAQIVLVQAWFRRDEKQLVEFLSRLRAAAPTAIIAFLDAMAPSDLRLARLLDPSIDFYIKKSILRDESIYFRPTYGGAFLGECYNRLYGLPDTEVDWNVPKDFMRKLRLGPNFFTDPYMIGKFAAGSPPPPWSGREFDIHARLATGKSGWYQRMRQAAAVAVQDLPSSVSKVTGAGVPKKVFWDEMRRSKICFSPFGYGELCWRDVEAFACGAVLVKQDMSHLRTDPDLFIAGETYAPIRWDYQNLAEVVDDILRNKDWSAHLVQTGFRRVSEYICKGAFVDQFSFLFDHGVRRLPAESGLSRSF